MKNFVTYILPLKKASLKKPIINPYQFDSGFLEGFIQQPKQISSRDENQVERPWKGVESIFHLFKIYFN